MAKSTPLKRHEALKNLSREHHDGLVFCLRIQKGISKSADLHKMEEYAKWFWENQLIQHFQIEEAHLFPILSKKNKLVIEAKNQHQQLEKIFTKPTKNYQDFEELFQLLKTHIRFEERKLFIEIQEKATASELKMFAEKHKFQQECGTWNNVFWK
ncbi:MAG: hemerythrin domain-containing protein [Bacteroidota bacterium]